ncbi:MAG: beta-ketoacyl-ACP synthase II [Deltaproteobacteria bacterium]|nr:beta-ketoacyl-ACP synthase II [Deltaproteobacteria bacterium]
MRRRVAVTGMGLVTCLGTGVEVNWTRLIEGISGIRPITLFDSKRCQTKIAGEVPTDFDPWQYVPAKELRRLDRHQQIGLVAACQAVDNAGFQTPPDNPYRYAVVIGSGIGGLSTIEAGYEVLREKGPKRMPPMVIPMAVVNLLPGLVAMRFGFKGPNFGIVNACASSASAIGEAYRLVASGSADVAITGGAEAVVGEFAISAFNALRALSTRNDQPSKASRPFDRDRDGFVLAEGAGMLTLEEFDHARKRGAVVHAEIVGYGATSDAYHIVMPDPEGSGAFHAMNLAIQDAGINLEQVDYINAHGTSTDLNDKTETFAIKRSFGPVAYKLSISSTKSMTGHALGAAGAIEAIYTTLALERGIIPPTVNLDSPDPECDLNYTPNVSVERRLEYAISNSFAFGGQNVSLLFRRCC